MPPVLAERLRLLDGIPSFEAGFADPEMRARMDAFFLPPAPPTTAAVDAPTRSCPGRMVRSGSASTPPREPATSGPAGAGLDARRGDFGSAT